MAANSTHSRIFILDFGSQYTQVIARRIRECQVYSEIVRFDTPAAEIAAAKPKGLILSRGPAGKGDHLRFCCGDFSSRRVEANNFRINLTLTDSPRYDLRVLRAEI